MKPEEIKPRNYPYKFKIGDIVEATSRIERRDGRSILVPGNLARINEVFQTTPNSPQIIGLEIQGQHPMKDIVCFYDVPLKLVKPF